MPLYPNGSIPLDRLVTLDSGDGKHLTTPTSRAKWYALRAKVLREKGVTLEITAGWNAYRPLREQYAARAWACNQGNCLGAAQPGQSSHGGTWAGPSTNWVWVDAMAFDIHNYWRVPWDYFKAACKSVGLLADGIPLSMSGGVSEKHHIIDLDPWGAVPASLESEELDDMSWDEKLNGGYTAGEMLAKVFWQNTDYEVGKKKDGTQVARAKRIEARVAAGNAAIQALAESKGFDAAPILAAIEDVAERPLTLSAAQLDALAARINASPTDVKAAIREAFAEAFGDES